jgi:hypothetical protein
MLRHIALLFCVLFALMITGCGQSVSDKDMGTIINDIPKISGADQPYDMPQLGPPTEKNPSNEMLDE